MHQCATWILDAKYSKADLQSVARENCKHLSVDHQYKLLLGGLVQEFPPFFFLAGILFFQVLRIEIKTDATKRETIFDNAHQQIDCTCQLLHANQLYYLITSMSIAIHLLCVGWRNLFSSCVVSVFGSGGK
jgi:hypothetical protein